MYTLLVIDRNDTFLPRGWVSAILPPGQEPSEYEQSGKLWKVIQVPDRPPLQVDTDGELSSSPTRALIHNAGKITEAKNPGEKISSWAIEKGGLLKPVPGPETLDRSHSTIWDYGTGRTYSTPQAAYDALYASVGASQFTEVHYIRGWSGTYYQAPSSNVLYLSGSISPTRQYPLIVDVEDGEAVTFNNNGGNECFQGGHADHVRVRDLKLVNATKAIMCSPQADAQINTDWTIERIEVDGTVGIGRYGIYAHNTTLVQVIDCYFHDLDLSNSWAVAGGCHSSFNNDVFEIDVVGCRIETDVYGLSGSAKLSWLLINNTFKTTVAAVRYNGTNGLHLRGMLNNIFEQKASGFSCFSIPDLAAANVEVLHSDGNCFHPGSSGYLASFSGSNLDDLSDWQNYFGVDEHSIEADPKLDSGLVPQYDSPCLGAGVCWDYSGNGGIKRANSVDMGFEQLTQPQVPHVVVRRAPEIARRK